MPNPNDGEEGVLFFGSRVKKFFQWLYRVQDTSDYGVDAHIEVWEGGYPSGKLIGCQVKSGPSFFKERTPTGTTFRFEEKHWDYWRQHSLPIIVVLHDPDTDKCFWAQVTEKVVESTGKGWKMEIPDANVLTEKSREQLLAIYDLSEEQLRAKVLSSAEDWMRMIEQGRELFLEVDEYVNEFSGISEIRLIALGPATGLDEKWDIELKAEGWDVTDSLTRTFPWAEFKIDESFYRDRMLETFITENGYRDDEGKAYYDKETFELEFSEAADTLRPHINDGEEAEYRFTINLNKLGEGFLAYSNFISA